MRDERTERPDLERYAAVPLYNTKAVAQKTGIAAPTLRAWERRYAILSPERGRNDYRFYSERDIALIGWLKGRIDAGMSISQAIALFRHFEEEQQQLSREELLSESTSPSQEMVSASVVSEEQGKAELFRLRVVQEQLLDAFDRLDEEAASRLMASMLAIYPLEQVCTELVTPTLWEIGQRWERGLINVSIEHFASAFFHGWLTSLLRTMPTSRINPLVITCCAPGELHALAPLMLSLLLRRAGLHVAYLGQSIESADLLRTIGRLSPALICVSVTLQAYLEAVTELGRKVQELPSPRPVVVFGGQAFEQCADLIARVPGVYLDGDMRTAIVRLRRMVLRHAGE